MTRPAASKFEIRFALEILDAFPELILVDLHEPDKHWAKTCLI